MSIPVTFTVLNPNSPQDTLDALLRMGLKKLLENPPSKEETP